MAVLRISFLAICLAVVATAENRKQQHWSLFSSFSGDEPKPEVAKDKAEEQSEDKAETKTEVQSEDKQDGKDYNKIAPFGKEDTAKAGLILGWCAAFPGGAGEAQGKG
jgi:hypothetical protein